MRAPVLVLAIAACAAAPAAAQDAVRYPDPKDVPPIIVELADGLAGCDPDRAGVTRRPFGRRVLFAVPCAGGGRGGRTAFVLAADDTGAEPIMVMFPRPGRAREAEPLHHLAGASVDPAGLTLSHRETNPAGKPCRTEAQWRIDARGNAGLVSWRESQACSGDSWTAASTAPPKAAARAGRRGKGKAKLRGKGRKTVYFSVRKRGTAAGRR